MNILIVLNIITIVSLWILIIAFFSPKNPEKVTPAQEMNIRSGDAMEKKYDGEYKEILKAIAESANEGLFKIQIKGVMSEGCRALLKRDGFEVKDDKDIVVIEWKM